MPSPSEVSTRGGVSASIRRERVLAPADELVVDLVRAHDVVELLEGEVEDVLLLAQHAGPHEASGFLQQGLLVDEVAADHAVLRILAVPDEGPDAVDLLAWPPRPFAPRPAGPAGAPARPVPSPGPPRGPCSKRRFPAPGSKFSTLPRIRGTSVLGRSLQRGLVMSISPTQRMPYVSRKLWMASRASRPPSSSGSSSRKPSSSACCRKATTSGCGRIASATSRSASPISEVTLFGTDCVRVSAAFFSPSHSSRCSLSHHVASIADMNTWLLSRIEQESASAPGGPRG